MHKLEVQRSRGEGDGEQDDGVFFGQHAGRASKLGVGEFRSYVAAMTPIGFVKWLRMVYDFGRSAVVDSRRGQ
jgi:hypothetical protein